MAIEKIIDVQPENDFKDRSEKAIAEIIETFKKYEVTFLPRMDYKENGEAHVVVALFDARPAKDVK